MRNSFYFNKEKIGLFCPGSFEFINHLIGQLGYSQDDYDNENVKESILKFLEFLFELDIIKIYSLEYGYKPNQGSLSKKEALDYINLKWKKNFEYQDFYNLVLIGPQDWYIQKLEALGMTPTTNWITFVEEKIVNLEQWIEENKPDN